MGIEIYKDKESEEREALEEKKRKESEIERKMTYMNMAVQICVARQETSLESIIEMSERLRKEIEG